MYGGPQSPAMLKPGDAAPDFVLKDQDGEDLRLSRFAGHPIVLFFYPRDHAPGCTLEVRGLRDQADALAEQDARVVGVSLDDPSDHRAFRDKNGLSFPLLSDPDGRVHDLYEAWRTTLFGRRSWAVRRCTYLIDTDGIIRRVYRSVNPVLHGRQVVKDVRRLAAQRSWGKQNARLRDLRP